jgi:cytochrome c
MRLHRITAPLLAIALLEAGIAAALAQDVGDAAAGAEIFKKCAACHKVGPGARASVGPVLNGVVGREAGTAPGYNYSAAMKNSHLTWDAPTLTRYLKSPKTVVPGTKMTFTGLPSDKDAADVIAYLGSFDAEGNKTAAPAK